MRPELGRLNESVQKLNRKYMTAQMEFDKGKIFYPDANSTLRVAYGSVKGYFSRDAVYYIYYTTLKGIIEKDNPGIYDYDVPERLKNFMNQRITDNMLRMERFLFVLSPITIQQEEIQAVRSLMLMVSLLV